MILRDILFRQRAIQILLFLVKKTIRQNRPRALLEEEHKQCLIDFFNESSQAIIQDAVEELTSKFAGLEIKKLRVHEFMKEECNLTMKKATFWPEARNSKENVQKRFDWVVRWGQADMEFHKNYMFIDGAGFNINLDSSRGWTPKGNMVVVTTPLTKAPSNSIIGAISSVGVVNLSTRVPKAPLKIRKVQGGIKRKTLDIASRQEGPQGTTTDHCLRFLSETLDIMVKHDDMRGFYLIMDNAPVHTSNQIEKVVEERDRCYKRAHPIL